MKLESRSPTPAAPALVRETRAAAVRSRALPGHAAANAYDLVRALLARARAQADADRRRVAEGARP